MKKRNIVGRNIRTLRLEAGLTQEELALNSGLSQGYINQLESGKRGFTQKSLEQIVDALYVPMIDLFKGEERSHKVATIAQENIRVVGKKRPSKREFLSLLGDLPEHIVEHYQILLKMEGELWKKGMS